MLSPCLFTWPRQAPARTNARHRLPFPFKYANNITVQRKCEDKTVTSSWKNLILSQLWNKLVHASLYHVCLLSELYCLSIFLSQRHLWWHAHLWLHIHLWWYKLWQVHLWLTGAPVTNMDYISRQGRPDAGNLAADRSSSLILETHLWGISASWGKHL